MCRCFRNARWTTTCWNTGKRNLQEYFQSQGFYDVTVDFKEQPVQDDRETVEYAISRGMRYKLVRVWRFTGNHYFDKRIPSASGCSCSRRVF